MIYFDRLIIYFRKRKPRKNLLDFLKGKLFFVSGNRDPEKTSYISGNGKPNKLFIFLETDFYIQNSKIFRTTSIFRTLTYLYLEAYS